MTWSVHITWTTPTAPNADQLAALVDRLAEHSAALGIEAEGSVGAQLAIDASTLEEAVTTAARAVVAACQEIGLSCTPTGVEATTWEALERAQAD